MALVGAETFAGCWERGAAMSVDTAVQMALDGDTGGR